ncbi:hypothetical protein [Clostridium sp.]|uniref:hypothetical protein n=1 Tax=Clostridium sp. TaxID=1506 RepID=UPI003F35E478
MEKPLSKWYCDVCGELIERPEDGYVQFNRNNPNYNFDDFIIVHHYPASPLKDKRKNGCYKYHSDLNLIYFLGDEGRVYLLSFLDKDLYYHSNPDVQAVNLREWNDLFMRVQVSYYEEARRYWDKALADGYYDDSNDFIMCSQANLKSIVLKYGDQEP